MIDRTAFAGMVALGFGAREAAAAPGAAREERPWCADDQHCQNICDETYPDRLPVGICMNSTCWCCF